MSQEIKPEDKEFLDRTMKHRKAQVEELAYKALAVALRTDISVFELPYYVLQQARKVIADAVVKVDFNNPELQKARLEFLKVCLKSIKDNVVPTPLKEIKDATDTRDNQCEPVVQAVVDLVLDEGLIFSDTEYFDKVLANEESVPLTASLFGYVNALDEKLLMVISNHWRIANEEFWGTTKEEVTFSMLDKQLKKRNEKDQLAKSTNKVL